MVDAITQTVALPLKIMSAGRPTPLERKRQLLFDPLKLSDALGYDFSHCAHAAELIDSVGPKILESAELTKPIPFAELSKTKNRLTLWSRGHFKTSAVALYIVNLILAYPDVRILIMQSTATNARGLLSEIKSHFDGKNPRSKLAQTFPNYCQETRLGTASQFTTPARTRVYKESTVTVAGGRTSKAGQHYDFIFADDLVTEQNFRNQDLQEKLIVEFNHYSSLLSGTSGYKTVTGTRYSFGDLYGHIIRSDAERREWNISIRNCWKNQKDLTDGPLFTQREVEPGRNIGFTTEQLLALQKDDPETFSCQYLNQPLIAAQQIFTEPMILSAVRPRNQNVEVGPAIQFIDLGGSASDRNDNSVIVTGRQDASSRMYVCDIKSGRFTPSQFTEIILTEVLRYRPVRVLVEGTAAGTYFIEHLRAQAGARGINIPVDAIKVRTHKDAKRLRISAMDVPLKQGRLLFLAGLPGWADLVQQFTEYPRGRHDDEIDTISLMVQHFTSTQGFVHTPNYGLPFFLRTPGQDFSFERRITEDRRPVETCGDDFSD